MRNRTDPLTSLSFLYTPAASISFALSFSTSSFPRQLLDLLILERRAYWLGLEVNDDSVNHVGFLCCFAMTISRELECVYSGKLDEDVVVYTALSTAAGLHDFRTRERQWQLTSPRGNSSILVPAPSFPGTLTTL